jgi:hypothetical protein
MDVRAKERQPLFRIASRMTFELYKDYSSLKAMKHNQCVLIPHLPSFLKPFCSMSIFNHSFSHDFALRTIPRLQKNLRFHV